jgi:NhaP-type Na+/H+ or K+/H+ antiporter
MYNNLAVLAVFAFVYSAVAGRIERSWLSGPIVFVAFGLASGPNGLGILNVNVTTEGLQTIAELTLAFVLFTDAANADLGVLRHNLKIPERLLLIGLPLTIGLGFVLGVVIFPGLSAVAVALLATMLAPTDAALGKSVVTNPVVPAPIRESLNFESGLNDGICVPVLLVFLGLAIGTEVEGSTVAKALRIVAEQIGIGLAVGLGLTAAAAYVIKTAASRKWLTPHWVQIPVITLAAACFAVAHVAGGSGFIACFVGGLLTSAIAKQHKHELLLAAEGTGDVLALFTWVIFGAAVVGQAAGNLTWEVALYAVLSLTVIRMLPVALVLAGAGVGWQEKLFIGWFGPRGLASIVFAIIVFHEGLPQSRTLALVVVCTVILSIVAHGMSANPIVTALGAKLGKGSRENSSK